MAYPTADVDFIITEILKSNKVIQQSQIRIGNTISFTTTASVRRQNRVVLIRILSEDQVPFEMSVSLATRFCFLGSLLDFFRTNRNWKDGGYFK